MTAMTIVSGSSFPVNSAFATALSRIVRNAFAALTGYRAGPRPDLCATHRPYVRIGTACLRAATFSRYSRAFSTVRPRSCLASSIDFFHAIGRSRPYARAIVSILYSTVYPSFVIRSSLQRHELPLAEGVAAVGDLLLPARLHEACALAQLPPCRLRETAAHLLRHAFTSVAASPSAASVSGTSGRPSGREERHIRRSTACRRAGAIRLRGDGRRDSSRPRGP